MKKGRVETVELSVEPDGPALERVLAGRLGLVEGEFLPPYRILRRSVDARKRGRVRIFYRLAVGDASPGPPARLPRPAEDAVRVGGDPVVIGSGPAGTAVALALVERGYRPLVLERGEALERRCRDVSRLLAGGGLRPESNLLFGEGGAGTFSDGKLTCRSGHPLVQVFFRWLLDAGAPPEIAWEQRPHIGTDRLRGVMARLRRRVEAAGGRYRFKCRVNGLQVAGGRVRGVVTEGGTIDADAVFLAAGHSARDTYRMLEEAGVRLEPKDFAVGLRIEHEQSLIDRAQYGRWAGHPLLGPADYRLAWTDPESGRGVYSFCNCPGGVVVPSMHERGTVATNGMSRYLRDSGRSNAALVVAVRRSDYFVRSALDGLWFQRRIEAGASRRGGGEAAPAQRTADFLSGRPSRRAPECTYGPGTVPAAMDDILPPAAAGALRRAIPVFERRIRGFGESVLIGPETRTSSPVRIARDPASRESSSVRGLYPVGEGAGYSGGIVSSAVDALKTAALVAEAGPRG